MVMTRVGYKGIMLLACQHVYVYVILCCSGVNMSMFMTIYIARLSACLCLWHIILLFCQYVYVYGVLYCSFVSMSMFMAYYIACLSVCLCLLHIILLACQYVYVYFCIILLACQYVNVYSILYCSLVSMSMFKAYYIARLSECLCL